MPSTDRLLQSLTSAQREAVQHIEGPQLVLAGPGSGKTRVVTHRIAYLMQSGVAARQIFALTFTNKAADEMRNRLAHLAPGRPVWISTFHRFCARLLREYAALVGLGENFTIFDTDDVTRMLRRVTDELGLDTTHYSPERIAAAIGAAKHRLVRPDEYEARRGSPLGSIVAAVYPRYQSRLLAANAVDFDDLLMHVAVLLRENPEVRATLDERFRYVLVDEYQDTNLAQYMIVRALSNDYPNLSVTGDPDQAIYGWRGANLGNILDFERDYPRVQVVRLEQNYRSTKRILRVADALIANNVRRKKKALFTDNDEGPPVRLVAYPTQKDEAREIAARIAADIHAGRRRPRDFAIFYRINALSRELEFALREQGIPYQLVNSVEFYQRREIKDVMAYLHLINNPRNDVALLRIINAPPRGIGKTTIDRLAEHATRGGMTLLDAAREAGLVPSLAKRSAVAVARFVALFDSVRERAASAGRLAAVEEVIGHVLAESGYEEYLKESDAEEDEDRLANIQELLTAARQFDEQHPGDGALEAFLEQASLVNDTDAFDADNDRVALMTIHSAKGLEFPVVYAIAVEHGILPHERSKDDPEQLEEERRLLFVAITRAREELQLSIARYREFRGQRRMTVPSVFLMELPRSEMVLSPKNWGALDAVIGAAADDDAWTKDEALEDDSFDIDSFGEPRAAPTGAIDADDLDSPTSLAAQPAMRLTTAAELATDRAPSTGGVSVTDITAVAADDYAVGMLVRHPDYGLGKITATSGTGPRRTATVNFLTGAGQKKFVLEKSPLQPVG